MTKRNRSSFEEYGGYGFYFHLITNKFLRYHLVLAEKEEPSSTTTRTNNLAGDTNTVKIIFLRKKKNLFNNLVIRFPVNRISI